MNAGQRAARPAAFVSRLSGGRPGLRYPFFPAGLFKEKPRKIFFAGKASAADGRAQRANPGGFLSFLFGSFSFTERKRTKKKNPQNIFCRQTQAPLTGGRGGPTQAGLWLSFLVLFSFPGKKREQTKTGQRAVI